MDTLTIGDIVDVIRKSNQPVVSTSQIASETGFSRQHVGQFLRDADDDRVAGVEVGNSRGWYLRRERHPAQILEDSLEGAKLVKIAEVDCHQCHAQLTDGDTVIALFERTNFQWDALDGICPEHVTNRPASVEDIGYEGYISETSNDIEFVVCRGICERIETSRYPITVIQHPIVTEYLPRTEPRMDVGLRPDEKLKE